MSADNYYQIQRHPKGGYAVVMAFTSTFDDFIRSASERDVEYPTLLDAIGWATHQYSEYGVQISPECYSDATT